MWTGGRSLFVISLLSKFHNKAPALLSGIAYCPPFGLGFFISDGPIACECCVFLVLSHWVGVVATRSAADVAKHRKEIT